MIWWCAVAWLVMAGMPAMAQGDESPREAQEGPSAPRSWDAVLGFVASYAPEYAGASRWSLGVRPGGWVRWGRVSIASRSAFVSRSGQPVSGGGLRLDLSPNERLRVGLGLRHDSGRRESASADLRGLGDVRSTVRLRLGASYPLDSGWRLGSALSIDALGHGGGTLGDINIGRGFPLGPSTSGSLGAALSFGNQRHMRAFYGVSPEQSVRSGYPVYEPGAGAREISVSAGLRQALGARWFAFGGVSAAHLVGPAAASPFVREPTSWAISVGLAYRF